tara:strand:+ start:348 stop:650 length:303 start_codon:yes stop_codon:yes gene_type:complete
MLTNQKTNKGENMKPIAYYADFLETLERNTDNNLHTENVVLIATNFGDDRDKRTARQIQKEHDDLGHMPFFCSLARSYLTDCILLKMKNKKLAKAISSKL